MQLFDGKNLSLGLITLKRALNIDVISYSIFVMQIETPLLDSKTYISLNILIISTAVVENN
jgi:hypothetical protein